MLYLVIKAGLSGIIIAVVSEVARRNPGAGALIASLPLASLLVMIWLWRDTHDLVRMADHSQATFWFVIPSLPMFLPGSGDYGRSRNHAGAISAAGGRGFAFARREWTIR